MMLDDEKYKQNKKNAMLHTALWKHLKGDQEMKTVVKKEVSEAIRSDQIWVISLYFSIFLTNK